MRINLQKSYLFFLFALLAFQVSYAQSTNQNTPTPVVSNEIVGTIPARAIGDPRATNYFYAFNGNQGDVFINIVTKNLDGDIDIFTIDGLRPLTKITLFSDNSESETGRILYLRKFEKLLLRIQGKSPNDEEATFRIKFAGSFEALPLSAEEIKSPEIITKNKGEVLVNSVGTIIGPIAKPIPEAKIAKEIETKRDDVAPDAKQDKEINVKSVDKKTAVDSSAKIEIRRGTNETAVAKDDVVVPGIEKETPKVSKRLVVIAADEDSTKAEGKEKNEDIPVFEESVIIPEPKIEEPPKKEEAEITPEDSSSKIVKPMKPEQLQKIELVVKFKDGKEIRKSMAKVFSFNVYEGILTIVSNDGKVTRYSLIDIEKILIE